MGLERNAPRRAAQDGYTPGGTMTVTVTLFADLRRFLPRGAEGPQRFTVRDGATLADLLATIGVAPDAEVTAAVDGELAARGTPLRGRAHVMLLSPVGGGPDRGRMGPLRYWETDLR